MAHHSSDTRPGTGGAQLIRLRGRDREIYALRYNYHRDISQHETIQIPEKSGSYVFLGTRIVFKEDSVTTVTARCFHGHTGNIQLLEFDQNVIFYLRALYLAQRPCVFAELACRYSKGRANLTIISCKDTFRVPILPRIKQFDVEFNPIKKVPIPKLPLPANSRKQALETPISEEVYKYFKEYLLDSIENGELNQPLGTFAGNMRRPVDIGTLSDSADRHIPYIDKVRRKTTGEPFVVAFPKMNSVTSDGKIRVIYPASSNLSAFLENFVGNRQPKIPYELIKGPKFTTGFQGYDVKTCDKVVFPYYTRFVYECFPEHERYLLPMLISRQFQDNRDSVTAVGYLNQFPSGLFGLTSLVGPCFAAAICQSLGVTKAQIQGDGIAIPLSEPQPTSEFLRKEEGENVINGFYYDHMSKPHYVNAARKLKAIRMKTFALNGQDRWHFLYVIYEKILHALPDTLPVIRSPDLYRYFSDLSVQELLETARSHDIEIPYINLDQNDVEQLPHTLSYHSLTV